MAEKFKILWELNNIKNYLKEIQENHDKELFIVDFWLDEIKHSLSNIEQEINELGGVL